MKLKNFSKKTNSRLEKYILLLEEGKIPLFMIDDPIGIYYLTGIKASRAKLFVHKTKTHLFVDGRYIEVCKKKAPCAVTLISEASLISYLEGFSKDVIGFDRDLASFVEYAQLKKLAKGKINPLFNPLNTLRFIKDRGEIQKMKKSAALLEKGFYFIKKRLKVGVSEEEIARDFTIFTLREGAEKLAFDPIIAFGKNSSMPHYNTGKTVLKKDQIVLVDIGVTLDGYNSDMTRTFFYGKASGPLKKVHEVVQKAKLAALDLCRPGTKIGALDLAARAVMKKENMEEYFTHSLGHSIGLEAHEFPGISNQAKSKNIVLEPGMIFTVEPGIYIPNVGGVRLEDTILITRDGYQNFFSIGYTQSSSRFGF